MKIAYIIVRTLFGLLLLFASISFLLNLVQPPELTGNVKLFMEGMIATGYMMTFVKGTELVCGAAFVTGFFVPLAAVVMAPISLNIFLFHLFVDQSGLGVGLFVVLANLFLGFYHRAKYEPMLAPK